jgi:hypothetical protein
MRRAHRRTHRRVWIALAFILPAVVLISLAARRTGPIEAASVRIAAP